MSKGAAMIRKHLKAAVMLAMLFTFVFQTPTDHMSPTETAMDSVTQKSVKLPIIMYHSILNDPKKRDVYVTMVNSFKNDLKYLKDNGFETVLVQDLIDYVNGVGTLPQKPVMITFDDGHYNNLHYVLPILEEMDMKAVISIVGKYADAFSINPDPNPNYAYLSWNEIKQLKDSGRFEVQNHSYSMHTIGDRRGSQRKNGESEASYCLMFNEDAMKQQTLLQEHCGITPTAFVYPFGLVCPEAQDCLRQMRFSASMTCSERINLIQAGNPDCLFDLGRFNRSGKFTTAAFMKKLLKQLH